MRLKAYIMMLPAKPNNIVVFNFPEKAIIKDKNNIITLTPLHPSMILAIYFPLIITFIEGSSGCGKT